jgi:hypothetical protein
LCLPINLIMQYDLRLSIHLSLPLASTKAEVPAPTSILYPTLAAIDLFVRQRYHTANADTIVDDTTNGREDNYPVINSRHLQHEDTHIYPQAN